MENKVAARVAANRWYARFPRALPTGAFLLAAALTALCVFAIERVEAQGAQEKVAQVAKSVTAAIDRRASSNSAYLLAGAALIAERESISSEQFRRFTEQLSRDPNFHSAEGMGWAKLLVRGEEAAFTAAMRAQGYADYRIFPAGGAGNGVRVPVTILEPETPRNRVTMGYDLYSEPVRRAAMDLAARSNTPTASGKIVLIQDQDMGNRAGFLMFMPVFDQHGSNSKLVGFVYSGFTAQTVLNAALTNDQRANYGTRLFDGEPRADRLLAEVGVRPAGGVWRYDKVTIAGRVMTLGLEAPKPARLSSLSVLTLLFGLLAAAMILIVIRLITRQAIEDRNALAWFEQQASIRNSLMRELNHRVKNTLANVLSIISLTKRRASNLDEFSEALMGRIGALSATHDLLTQSEWGTTPIRSVVDAELAPYLGGAEGTVVTRGPQIEIAPNDALSLGLALHELATNASKFGALSVPAGTVEVQWDLVTQGLARVVWTERGGPPVVAGNRRGFGTELIEKIVAHELGTAVDLRFDPGGVNCTLLVPVRLPVNFRIRADRD
ncbi:MAG TPA: CHASE domain-containing protein [Novosphingobium sp.]|nr:CHASE domain-containing protein [Novosphingobium sp.]